MANRQITIIKSCVTHNQNSYYMLYKNNRKNVFAKIVYSKIIYLKNKNAHNYS